MRWLGLNCRLVLSILALSVLSLPARAEWHFETRAIMGTEIRVALWQVDKELAARAVNDVMAEMERINQLLSPYIETSELSRVNENAATTPQVISPEFYKLVEHSLRFSRLSNGAFDITFASVGWLYDYRNKVVPSSEQLGELKPAINFNWIVLDPAQSSLAFKHKNVRIDLGGIAKGYAVDRAIALLKDHGIAHASVSAGGDSYLLGDRRGRPWLIGIKHPRPTETDHQPVMKLPLSNTAVSTSGDYERYFIDRSTGERVHHIVNPATGKSAGELMSVTILADRGLDADPLSTTVFVLGAKKGLELVNRLQGVEAIIINRKGDVTYSEGLAAPE